MGFQCFSSAHTADLNKCDNNYNMFLVFVPAEELPKARKSIHNTRFILRILIIRRRLRLVLDNIVMI